MQFYLTKQTAKVYQLGEEISTFVNCNENDVNNEMTSWGLKHFYFEGWNCLQVVNFASKLTIFLFNVQKEDLEDFHNMLCLNILLLFNEDQQMNYAIQNLFNSSIKQKFGPLKNRSIIATLNRTEANFAENGDYFYGFIENGILRTREINIEINFEYFFSTKTGNKTNYSVSSDKFKELLIDKYGK